MSDINTAMVDGLKALDPKRPIREADINGPRMASLLESTSAHAIHKHRRKI